MSTSIRGLRRSDLTHGIVQVSLDLKTLDDGLRMAAIAVEAGADWLEIGTPLVMAEGVRAVRALRKEYPDHPLVADLKIMDGGYGETTMYAEAGADAVVVMGRAHDATVQRVCEAGRPTESWSWAMTWAPTTGWPRRDDWRTSGSAWSSTTSATTTAACTGN